MDIYNQSVLELGGYKCTRRNRAVKSRLGHMRALHTRLVMVMTLSFVALVVSQAAAGGAQPAALLAAGLSAVVLTSLIAARYSATMLRTRVITVGSRAREHRQSLFETPEPQHPNTVGRVRARAPGQASAAA